MVRASCGIRDLPPRTPYGAPCTPWASSFPAPRPLPSRLSAALPRHCGSAYLESLMHSYYSVPCNWQALHVRRCLSVLLCTTSSPLASLSRRRPPDWSLFVLALPVKSPPMPTRLIHNQPRCAEPHPLVHTSLQLPALRSS
jgi:hypothetical protein